MTERALTKPQLQVLRAIANPCKGDNPFPNTNTVNALIRRGLVREQEIERTPGMSTIMAALGAVELVVTHVGRDAIRRNGELATEPQK